MGQVAFGEPVLNDYVVEHDSDEPEDANVDPFGKQYGLAIAILAPVVVAYGAIGYGLYLAWGALGLS